INFQMYLYALLAVAVSLASFLKLNEVNGATLNGPGPYLYGGPAGSRPGGPGMEPYGLPGGTSYGGPEGPYGQQRGSSYGGPRGPYGQQGGRPYEGPGPFLGGQRGNSFGGPGQYPFGGRELEVTLMEDSEETRTEELEDIHVVDLEVLLEDLVDGTGQGD
ncbi:hypothetical protein V3C99_006707, partial [Haemonchus contortus]